MSELEMRRSALMQSREAVDWEVISRGLIQGTLSGDIILPDDITYIRSYAFSGMEITSLQVNGAKRFGRGAFNQCMSLKTISISVIDYIEAEVFSNCRELETPIIVSNIATSIPQTAFFNCYKIPYYDIGENVASIGNQCFRYSRGCQYVIMRPLTPPTLGSSCFDGGDIDYPIYVPDSAVEAYKTANVWSNYASRIFSINDLNT